MLQFRHVLPVYLVRSSVIRASDWRRELEYNQGSRAKIGPTISTLAEAGPVFIVLSNIA